jgi:hypothetical protein
MSKDMTQVKFTLESDIVASFKAYCASEGVSMASMIRKWMVAGKQAEENETRTDTRPHRRRAVQEAIILLEDVLHAEAGYRDAIPEAFLKRRDSADWACGQLEMAIDFLKNTF